MSGPTELDETPAEEFSRLIIEFNEGERQNRNEAWNLIADFACEHSDAIIRALSQPQAGEPVAAPQHVAYFDDGQFHWMSGIAPRNCELYASPQPANPAQVTDAIRGIVEDALNSAIPEPWEVAEHATQRILAAIGAGGQAVNTDLLREARDELDNWVTILDVSEDQDEDIRDARNLIARIDMALSQPHPADERVVEALREARELLAGPLVGVEWKRACHSFVAKADAALSAKEGR